MSALEEMLRDALATRAAQSPVDPDAWAKTVGRNRRFRPRLPGARGWPAWFGWLAPVTAAVTMITIVLGTLGLAGLWRNHAATGLAPAAPPSAPSPITVTSGAQLPAEDRYMLKDISPTGPVTRLTANADHARVSVYVWFGYVPGDAAAGQAICDAVQGGFYDGIVSCARGWLPFGDLVRIALHDGSAWFRIGVSDPRFTRVTAQVSGGQQTAGVITAVPGQSQRLWAVVYPVQAAATLVFADGRTGVHTRLFLPGPQNFPHVPSHGGITVFRSARGPVVMYRMPDGSIQYVIGNYSEAGWTGRPVSPTEIGKFDYEYSGPTPPPASFPRSWFGYAPGNAARVTIQLGDGRTYSGRTRPGWPGSGFSLWGPILQPQRIGSRFDMLVISYDSAGNVLQEIPVIFLGGDG